MKSIGFLSIGVASRYRNQTKIIKTNSVLGMVMISWCRNYKNTVKQMVFFGFVLLPGAEILKMVATTLGFLKTSTSLKTPQGAPLTLLL